MQFFVLMVLKFPVYFLLIVGEPFRFERDKYSRSKERKTTYMEQLTFHYWRVFVAISIFLLGAFILTVLALKLPYFFVGLILFLLLVDLVQGVARFLWFKKNVIKGDSANALVLYGQGGWKDDPPPPVVSEKQWNESGGGW